MNGLSTYRCILDYSYQQLGVLCVPVSFILVCPYSLITALSRLNGV